MIDAVTAILSILIWGVISTLVLTSMLYSSQKLGWSRMNWSLLVGTLFTGDRHVATILGFVLNFLGGCLLAFVYFLVFALVGRAGWWMGLIGGLGHGIVLLTVFLPLLAHGHPRIATEYDGADQLLRLEPPGLLALNYGYRTPLVTLVSHGSYGAILGAGFHQLL